MPQKPETDIRGFARPAAQFIRRTPAYLWTIIIILMVPVTLLTKHVLKMVHKRTLLCAIAAISLIGWAWSWTMSYNGWWSFGEQYMTGWQVLPYLPLEELLFCPFGGLLCIYLYVLAHKLPALRNKKSAGLYWGALVLGTLVFGLIAFLCREHRPAYLYSQFLAYNLLCLLIAPLAAKEVELAALAVPVAGLGTVGFLWDLFAIKKGLWVFLAVTKIYVLDVPLDEFNYYFFAPIAAVSVYLLACRLFGLPAVKAYE